MNLVRSGCVFLACVRLCVFKRRKRRRVRSCISTFQFWPGKFIEIEFVLMKRSTSGVLLGIIFSSFGSRR